MIRSGADRVDAIGTRRRAHLKEVIPVRQRLLAAAVAAALVLLTAGPALAGVTFTPAS
jgi:hypothetical protein